MIRQNFRLRAAGARGGAAVRGLRRAPRRGQAVPLRRHRRAVGGVRLPRHRLGRAAREDLPEEALAAGPRPCERPLRAAVEALLRRLAGGRRHGRLEPDSPHLPDRDHRHRRGSRRDARTSPTVAATRSTLVAEERATDVVHAVRRSRAADEGPLRVRPQGHLARQVRAGLEYADGILFIAENPSATLHKISEIYDRLAFAGVGKYSEFDSLRIAGIQLADIRGYSYGREDVKARRPRERVLAGPVGDLHPADEAVRGRDPGGRGGGTSESTELFHILFDGSVERRDGLRGHGRPDRGAHRHPEGPLRGRLGPGHARSAGRGGAGHAREPHDRGRARSRPPSWTATAAAASSAGSPTRRSPASSRA